MHQPWFTHLAARDGGKDHEDKLEEDGIKVRTEPQGGIRRVRRADAIWEARPGRRANEGTQRNRTLWRRGDTDSLWSRGMWGGKLPSTWEPIDAEMYAILAYLRKMASASDARVGVRAISKDDETGIAHGRGGGTAVERSGCSNCLLYTSPSPRDVEESRMPSSA